jgi:S-adenosylmethionine-diacylglycerol 3-amino-3-carboxypropyl transferase
MRLSAAVHRHKPASAGGLLERLFTLTFRNLVYPQIWEDPVVDMEALALTPQSRVITIASGGCNVLSYLIGDPREVIAVDLNRAHVALTRLKLAAARHLPAYEDYYRFFGDADLSSNVAAYDRFLAPHLDPETRAYWQARDLLGRRRITLFARRFYHHGVFGRFLGIGHRIARLYGVDPRELERCRTTEEQRRFFQTRMAPLFDKPLIRWATSAKASLFGLGIPPAQYESLAAAMPGGMAAILRHRLERLATAFPLEENYFAWQAFGRRYAPGGAGPLPPYLQRRHFSALRQRVERVQVVHRSLAEQLRSEADGSLHGYVLLDAQDWMTDAQLAELWREITRTAAPGARVIFRTAAAPSILPGRLDEGLLGRWTYAAEESHRLGLQDRSATYGGFHLYIFRG